MENENEGGKYEKYLMEAAILIAAFLSAISIYAFTR
jgi:hypothetical protein